MIAFIEVGAAMVRIDRIESWRPHLGTDVTSVDGVTTYQRASRGTEVTLVTGRVFLTSEPTDEFEQRLHKAIADSDESADFETSIQMPGVDSPFT